MEKRVLALGSVIYLNGGLQKIMILSRGVVIDTDEGQRIFDYSACLYPSGLTKEDLFFFNDEDVSTVLHEGFVDEDENQFKKVYEDWVLHNNFIKGKVDNS